MKKHITPKQKAKIAVLKAAGYNIPAIAEICGVSISTVKRHSNHILKGCASEKLIKEAQEELLATLTDDNIKHQMASAIKDEISLTQRIRSNALAVLEKIETTTPETIAEMNIIAKSLSSLTTAIKLGADTLRASMGVTQRELHVDGDGTLPELVIRNMTHDDIEEIKKRAERLSAGITDDMAGYLPEDNEVITEGFTDGESELVLTPS